MVQVKAASVAGVRVRHEIVHHRLSDLAGKRFPACRPLRAVRRVRRSVARPLGDIFSFNRTADLLARQLQRTNENVAGKVLAPRLRAGQHVGISKGIDLSHHAVLYDVGLRVVDALQRRFALRRHRHALKVCALGIEECAHLPRDVVQVGFRHHRKPLFHRFELLAERQKPVAAHIVVRCQNGRQHALLHGRIAVCVADQLCPVKAVLVDDFRLPAFKRHVPRVVIFHVGRQLVNLPLNQLRRRIDLFCCLSRHPFTGAWLPTGISPSTSPFFALAWSAFFAASTSAPSAVSFPMICLACNA